MSTSYAPIASSGAWWSAARHDFVLAPHSRWENFSKDSGDLIGARDQLRIHSRNLFRGKSTKPKCPLLTFAGASCGATLNPTPISSAILTQRVIWISVFNPTRETI